MNIGVSPEEISETFQSAYPKEYSIVVLSILNQKQANKIAELEAAVKELKPEEEKEKQEPKE